ncbi:hypothetical protein IQ241_16840 [Romeria aff. gracilis LEGE 07310]|uniref:Uncharacterized protein n=1 Tax=Vasconcelosia minhoensis LEGE 07310 TaxID=915328 RepID=A0A8J7AA41_9CYAN|nr:hypothetical protein [Romeria gracilis]MBE9078940.1 hypothetical protein [Romeria aff. gracilis LEGE 07310]
MPKHKTKKNVIKLRYFIFPSKFVGSAAVTLLGPLGCFKLGKIASKDRCQLAILIESEKAEELMKNWSVVFRLLTLVKPFSGFHRFSIFVAYSTFKPELR